MESTSNQPFSGTTGTASIAHSDNVPAADSTFSTTAAHATGDTPYPSESSAATQPAAGGVQEKLTSALESGKKWLSDSGIAEQAQQLPKTAKDLGTKAWTNVSGLTTTQKAVGIGLLAAGVAFLATRGKGKDAEYRDKPRKSPFDKKKSGSYAAGSYAEGRSAERPGQRPWGSSRYGNAASAPAGSGARISSGSGYSSGTSSGGVLGGRSSAERSSFAGGNAPKAGQRRDQGPAAGTSYNAGTSGSQNPNNVDQSASTY